ncbi:hypothetical protein DFP72DRAFT_1175152 [Ephemerocybe angulata]|uniref:Uncharacterized protein n=1 Tax=Ephemerocybe angulata TaxID=980116 RepID=A0A8H6LX21_9AGAR|nr:hypothetical protein DFP72DRAFT_1175152 [Tulosesus angulatus]
MSQIKPLPLDLTDRIPQEIFHEVAAFAKYGDRESLKNFSLVSHQWEVSTRSLLFSYIDLNSELMSWLINGKPRACQRILPCVQHARFTFNPVGLEKEVSAIYLRMLKLRELEFLRSSAQLVLLLGEMREVSERITNLKLARVYDFSSFRVLQQAIASFPGIQTLSMSEIAWQKGSVLLEGGVEAEFPVPHTLKKVTNEWMMSDEDTSLFLSWLAQRSDTIRYIEAGGLMLSKFVRVETLIIGPRWTADPPRLQTLSDFKALRTLKIRSAIWLFPHENRTWYLELLSSVTSPLSHLTFTLAFEFEEELEHMNWTALNSLFQNSPFYAGLKAIEINLEVGDHDHMLGRDDCERMIRRRVVGLRPGTRLTVKVNDEDESILTYIYD